MQSLPPALFLVMLELTAGSFFTLYLLDLRGDTSRGYIVFQGALYILFAALTWGAMQSFGARDLLCHAGLCKSDLDAGWLAWQAPLVIAFTLAMIPWNVLLWLSPSPRRKGSHRAAEEPAAEAVVDMPKGGGQDGATATAVVAGSRARAQRIVLARHLVGGLTAALGISVVFVVAMAYRPLADAHLGGVFLVGAFLAGTIALGGVMTAMLLGHWYLNTPTASGKPLEFSTTLLLAGVALELLFTLLIGPSTAHPLAGAINLGAGATIHASGTPVVLATPTAGPSGTAAGAVPKPVAIDTSAMVGLQYMLGLLAPLALGGVALWLTRGRSFQSATGMLYLATAFIFIGEILARGLLLVPIL